MSCTPTPSSTATRTVHRLQIASIFIALSALSMGASAHTGHGTHSLMEGLAHPFGPDHLLAMLAVGVWSVSALPANKAWQGPATFLLALVLSAIVGASGLTVPFLEHAIALSVSLFGLMLMVAAKPLALPMPTAFGLGLVAVAASLHGLAHGAETPASGFAGYAAGFVLTTALLHAGGVLAGLGLRRWLAERSTPVLAALGGGLGLAGMYLFSQL
ncbi:HupE/UreJ family protein [Curvibacter sp. CHRR-16]|uniref:HupE/UreJ family protein n=1 Tax=Curvibacter sp. CHRR-16 TaxID=2835872 RepID=UPI001BD9327A|nr:HupE/UreJ family protein [Curvibacter sp. CHRR-16]MBT0570885.1 HupE/UreJ family protein [Curvibacter sp. CHRR-16]